MLTEYLTSFLSLFFSNENQLIIMFISALLSASLLPGNSEIIFTTIATQLLLKEHNLFSENLIWLLIVATIGNSLGSLITFAMGWLVPKPKSFTNKYAIWAINNMNRYGALMLLLSWLPIIGDVLCGVAGWLRLSIIKSVIYIAIGKLCRYLLLLASVYSVAKYVL